MNGIPEYCQRSGGYTDKQLDSQYSEVGKSLDEDDLEDLRVTLFSLRHTEDRLWPMNRRGRC